ncbi:hypothetical protein, partial [Bradyrhizobium sp.]|uniref:hypothetical protein n=1 Tax=Bradyrhizobium sp. TaxID=376 RepID=UPI0025BAD23D
MASSSVKPRLALLLLFADSDLHLCGDVLLTFSGSGSEALFAGGTGIPLVGLRFGALPRGFRTPQKNATCAAIGTMAS